MAKIGVERDAADVAFLIAYGMARMTLEGFAGWVAPIATAIVAIVTAVNLGAGVTGFRFVVFLIGSLAWWTVGAATGQTDLLLTNGFLAIVNLVGIWRGLGRQAKYEQGGAAAAKARERRAAPDLKTLSSLIGAKVQSDDGGVGGLGERLRAVRREDLTLGKTCIRLTLDADRFEALPDRTPEAPPPAAVASPAETSRHQDD